MPGFSIGELFLIVIAVIIFVRPEDLPRFFRNVGKIYGEIQRQFTKMRTYTRDTLDEISSCATPPAGGPIHGSPGGSETDATVPRQADPGGSVKNGADATGGDVTTGEAGETSSRV